MLGCFGLDPCALVRACDPFLSILPQILSDRLCVRATGMPLFPSVLQWHALCFCFILAVELTLLSRPACMYLIRSSHSLYDFGTGVDAMLPIPF